MKESKRLFLFWLTLLLLPALACSLTDGTVTLPQATVPAVATTGAEVAATAAGVAATAAAQGGSALATAQASDIPAPEASMAALQEKLAAIQPDENGNFSVTLTDDELNQAIQAQLAAAEQAGAPNNIENMQLAFTGGNAVLTGNVTDPIVAVLTIAFQPLVVDGRLQFEVMSAAIGSIQVPPSLLATAEATLNTTLNEAMANMPNNVVLQDISIAEGSMSLSGRKVEGG
jgi:hypothetical protein